MTNSTQTWFAFRSANSQTIYGFGTAGEAAQYADMINGGKEINLYAAHALTDAEAADMGLDGNSEAVSLDDELRALADAE